jgi:hypothetical protein
MPEISFQNSTGAVEDFPAVTREMRRCRNAPVHITMNHKRVYTAFAEEAQMKDSGSFTLSAAVAAFGRTLYTSWGCAATHRRLRWRTRILALTEFPIALALIVAPSARADIVQLDPADPANIGFEILGPVLANQTMTIAWDMQQLPLGARVVRGRVGFGAGAQGIPAATVASMFAETLNGQINNAATAMGDVVVMSPTIAAVSLRTGTSPDFVQTFIENVTQRPMASLSFDPDPDTGSTMLTATGNFVVEGPGGIDIDFSAPENTTIQQLASLFATNMEMAGFEIFPEGSTTSFSAFNFIAPEPGTVSFLTDGAGLEYELSEVPEPSTALLFGTVTLALLGYRVLRIRRS